MRAAAEAKVDLSTHHETQVHVGYQAGNLPSLHYTREQLEDAMRPQLERAWSLILSTLRAIIPDPCRRCGHICPAPDFGREPHLKG